MNDTDVPESRLEAEEPEENPPDDFYIDILTGSKEKPSPKKLLDQYGFDRGDLEIDVI